MKNNILAMRFWSDLRLIWSMSSWCSSAGILEVNGTVKAIEVLVYNTNLTFLSFLYKIKSRSDPSLNSTVVHETNLSLKIYSNLACLAQLDRHQTCKPVMVSCEFNSHWRQLYFLKTPRYRSGTLNSNTVNSKFHLIRSFFEILARILSFHV